MASAEVFPSAHWTILGSSSFFVQVATVLGPMLGFKRFRNALITIAGIELVHRIRKGQFALERLRVRGKTTPEIWTAVLAA